jgi:hypothetical protein
MLLIKKAGTNVYQPFFYSIQMETLIKKYFCLNICLHSINVFPKHTYQQCFFCSRFCYNNYYYVNPLRVNYFHITNRASASYQQQLVVYHTQNYLFNNNNKKCRY